MRANTEQFTLADRVFFDHPARWRQDEPPFELATGAVPLGWLRAERDGWVSLTPAGLQLPWQGWKIHISSTPDSAPHCLATVSAMLLAQRVPFKFLRSPAMVQAANLKYAARSSSGKVITVYPVDLAAFERLVPALTSALDGTTGPYILSDHRIGEGPVFARYGGFRSRFCYRDDGERCLAIERPDGVLVPDERAPGSVAPSWVARPEALRRSTTGATDDTGAAGDTGGQPAAEFPYQVTAALHFSNGGGVYLARATAPGPAAAEVILKEARPHAGYAGDGSDAVTRLGREAQALQALRDVPGVPALLGRYQLWEHQFLAVEKMPGTTLQAWVAANNPLIGAEPDSVQRQAYAVRARGVLNRVRGAVERVHSAGYVVGDVHPANIMVDDNDEVSLVDFEAAVPVAQARRQHNGHAGFVAADASGFDIDRHALDVLSLWLLLPMTELLTLDPGRRPALTRIALQHFPSAAQWLATPPAPMPAAEAAADTAGTTGAAGTADTAGTAATADTAGAADSDVADTVATDLGTRRARAAMADAVSTSMTTTRTDRLFPGDFAQFEPGQGVAFGHGAAGVLWALTAAGHPLPDGAVHWLRRHAVQPAAGPGFMDGAAGVAYVLAQLGCADTAETVLEYCLSQVDAVTDVSLHSGLAGIGWALLNTDVGAGRERLTAAVELGDRLVDMVDDGRPHGVDVPSGAAGRLADAGTNAGLLRGWSGVALFLHSLHARTGSRRWHSAALRAARRDLRLCVTATNGSRQVDGGFRSWPYLDVGSAGVALVLDELARAETWGDRWHRPERKALHAELPALAAALESTFVIDAHLGRGRAGLMAAAARLAHTRPELGTANIAAAHLRRLSWHAVEWQRTLAFPADGLHRLSMDYLTGTAGVLAAVTATVDPSRPFIPFLAPIQIPGGDHPHRSGHDANPGVGEADDRHRLPEPTRRNRSVREVAAPPDGSRRETRAEQPCLQGVPTEPV